VTTRERGSVYVTLADVRSSLLAVIVDSLGSALYS